MADKPLNMTKIEVAPGHGRSLELEATDCDLALINSLRRTVLADIPNVAMMHEPYSTSGEQFVFAHNSGVLHDHLMAHRLSMVPLHLSRLEAQSYIPGSIKVRLVAENKGKVAMDVTTEHCEITLHDRPHPDVARLLPSNILTGDRPLLTVLKPGEKIDITGTAQSGTASRNAAFAVVSMCSFNPLLDAGLVEDGRKKAEAATDAVRAANRFEHIDRKRCWKPNPDGNPTAFRFRLESECGMTAADILASALDVLERKCGSAACAVSTDPDGMASFEIKGEGDTLGNLLQSAAVDELYPHVLSFVGYFRPHPLEDRVILRAYVAKGTPDEAFEAIKAAALARVRAFKGAFLDALSRVPEAA